MIIMRQQFLSYWQQFYLCGNAKHVKLKNCCGQRRGQPWERRSGPSSTRSCSMSAVAHRSAIRARSRACSTVARTRTVTRYVVSKPCTVGRASFVLFPVIFGYCGVDFCSFPFAFPLFACSTTTSFFRCCVARRSSLDYPCLE